MNALLIFGIWFFLFRIPILLIVANFTYSYYLIMPWIHVGLLFLSELPQLHYQTQLQLAYVYFSGMRTERKKCLPFFNYRQYLFIASDFREGFFFFSVLRLGNLNPFFQNNSEQRTCGQLQYSCLENPIDRRSWQATVQGVAKSWTQLSD